MAFIFGTAMWAIARYTDWLEFGGSLRYAGFVFLLAGAVFGFFALLSFYRKRTSIDPHKPEKASVLITDGLYSVSRNPMYLGLLLLLIAYGFYLGSLLSLLVIPFFVWYMNRWQIEPEEEVMLEKFGEEYRKYRSEVRRWL